MSGYNSLNYREQGGEKWVVGGTLAFEDGAAVEGFPLQALTVSSLPSGSNVATTVAKVNELLDALQESGLMASE